MMRAFSRRGRWLAILDNELRQILSQRMAVGASLLLAAAMAVALLLGSLHHQQQLDQQLTFQAIVDRQWADQPDRHPHRVAHFGTFAFRPPSSLAFFDPGVDRQVGNAQFLEAHRQNPANFAAAGQMPVFTAISHLSPAMLLQVLLPLLMLAIGGLSVAREREQGTWLSMRSQGLPAGRIVLSKGLAYALLGAIIVSVACLLTLVLITLVGGKAHTGTLVALAALGLAYLVYALFWAQLAVLVSALCKDSRQTLALLAGIWLLLVVVSPRAMPFLVALPDPPVDRTTFNAAIDADLRALGDSHNTQDPHFAAFRQATLKRYGVERVEDLPVNFGGLLMQEGERRTSEVFERHYATLQARWDGQEKRLTWLAVLNPVLALQQASAALAGTDRNAFRHFEAQAETYRYAFIQQLNQVHTHEIRYENDRGQRVSRDHWQAIAPFVYQPETLVQRLRRTGLPLAILFGWSLALPLLAAAFREPRR